MRIKGAWVPHWTPDVICVETALVEEIASQFSVTFREVRWPDGSPSGAQQLVIPVVGERWFDPTELSAMLLTRYDERTGARCAECGTWKWLPGDFGSLARVEAPQQFDSYDVVASPEWFGDAMLAYREVLVRRTLAELIQRASPRDFEINEVEELQGRAGSKPPFRVNTGVAVPAGLVSIFYAQFDDVAAPLADGVRPSAQALHKASQARALLQGSKGLISADALASIAQTFFEAGEDDHAFRLWRQAADQGSAIARRELEAPGKDTLQSDDC